MLHDLLVDMKLNAPDYGNVPTSVIERACSQVDVAQLEDILRKYTSAEDTFTQQYLYGKNENIKLLVDLGKGVESPEAAEAMYTKLREREPLFVRCLVEVFKAWHSKTTHTASSPLVIFPEVQDVSAGVERCEAAVECSVVIPVA